MSEKAEGAAELHDPGLRARAGRRKARANAATEFLGVCRRSGGKFAATIRESKRKSQIWLGTFDTAEDAARAFDAAAVKMRGVAARTNFKQPAAIVSSLVHVRAEPSGHECQTKFLGVCRQRSGQFGARIRASTSKGKYQKWLGTFNTAELAARAYDAAAVMVRGARAITNFKQTLTVDDGVVSPLLAEPGGQGARRHPSGEYIAQGCDRKGKAALALGGFDCPDTWHDDLLVDLPLAVWQKVDDLLKDMNSTDDREALIEAAAILQQISLAGHVDGRESRTNTNHERSAATASC